MDGYDVSTAWDDLADLYDELTIGSGSVLDPTACVDLLAAFAGLGPVLELGVGTGRVALPLASRGLKVHGIDGSKRMLALLADKPGAERLSLTEGDFAVLAISGSFSLVYVVYSTLFNLASQHEQLGCFARVGQLLEPGGVFVVEADVPDLANLQRGQRVAVVQMTADRLILEAVVCRPASQVEESQMVVIGRDGTIKLHPIRVRYAWPAELDLMAQMAGLTLIERWAGWDRSPFTSASSRHVSVYRKAEQGRLGLRRS
jgi:ubiquinone/menaquinone biosynthesis C-methylase UbiE